MFKRWCLCLFIWFIYTTRYFSTPLKCLASPFYVSMLTLPNPKSYCIQSIYHAPPSPKVEFKVATKTSGWINIKRSSPFGSTAPSVISHSEATAGWNQCLFDTPLPPNTSSSGFLIYTSFEYSWTQNLRPLFFGVCLHTQPRMICTKLIPHTERLAVDILEKLWLDGFDPSMPSSV